MTSKNKMMRRALGAAAVLALVLGLAGTGLAQDRLKTYPGYDQF